MAFPLLFWPAAPVGIPSPAARSPRVQLYARYSHIVNVRFT